MKCLHLIKPGPGATDEEIAQLSGLTVTKVHQTGDVWKVNPPAMVSFSSKCRDSVGNIIPADTAVEMLLPDSWLIPLDCTRKELVETHQAHA
jgi:hypothetical protein